jgi:hypothetical protein
MSAVDMLHPRLEPMRTHHARRGGRKSLFSGHIISVVKMAANRTFRPHWWTGRGPILANNPPPIKPERLRFPRALRAPEKAANSLFQANVEFDERYVWD